MTEDFPTIDALAWAEEIQHPHPLPQNKLPPSTGKKGSRETSETYKTHVKRFLNSVEVTVEKLKSPTYKILYNVLTDLSLPLPGQQFRIRTQQQINLISLILKIVKTHQVIDELTIATYTLNKEAYGILLDLLTGGRIKRLSLFLASSYSFRSPEEYAYFKTTVRSLQDRFDIFLVFAWLHFKITMARCGDNYYHIEGSMNYSTNNMAEQLIFENRRELYEFDTRFFSTVVMKTTHSALEIIGRSPTG